MKNQNREYRTENIAFENRGSFFRVPFFILCATFFILFAQPHTAEAAFPIVRATNTSFDDDGGANHLVSLPAGIQAGDLLVIVLGGSAWPNIDTPAGWTRLFTPIADGESGLVVYYRTANGSEGSTVTVAMDAGNGSVHNSYRISGASSIEAATALGNGDPPSLTPSWGAKDTLWFAVISGWNGSISAMPTNYTSTLSSQDSLPFYTASARRELNAASEDPSDITESFQFNTTATLAIKPRFAVSKPPNNLGLVGYWSFDEGTSTIATDFSGNGNHGTLSTLDSPLPTWTNGKRGRAIDFDGADFDYVQVSDSSSLQLTGSMTTCAWAKADVLNNEHIITIKANGSDETQFVFFVGDVSGLDYLAFYWNNNGVTQEEEWFTDNPVITEGSWHHLCAVRTGVTDVDIFVNGVSVATSQTAGEASVTTANTTLDIGLDSNPGASGWDGIIDEVRLYNRALGATEIATLAQSGAVKFTSSSVELQRGSTLANGLVGHWTFDGGDTSWTSGSAGTTRDRSGNNNTGTMTNMSRDAAQAQGKLGQAMNFDGSNDVVSVPQSSSVNNLGPLTVSAWVRPDVLPGGDGAVIVDKLVGDGGWVFVVDETAGIKFSANNSVSETELITSAVFTAGEWQHVVATWDGTLAGGANIRAYRNAVEYSNGAASTGSGTHNTDAGDDLFIGAFGIGTDPLDGRIDDVRVYNRVLTFAEIKQLYMLGGATIRP